MADKLGRDIGDAITIRTTEKAILVRLVDHEDRELWVPKSQIHDDSEVYGDGHEGVLVVSEWFAKKAEL